MAIRAPKTSLRDPSTPDVEFSSRRALVQLASFADKLFTWIARSGGIITLSIMIAVGLFLGLRAQTAFGSQGWNFLTETAWTPENGKFGIAAVLFGTVTIAIIALTVSVPLALGTSLLISELLPERIRGFAISLVDLMAAVPSVIFGLWGVFFLQANIIPISLWVSQTFSWIPFLAVTDKSGNPLRSNFAVKYPARVQLVIAANPCPCGKATSSTAICQCTELQKTRYLGRLSGPLLDRIDIQLRLHAARPEVVLSQSPHPEGSSQIAQEVLEARMRAQRRLTGTPWAKNSDVPGTYIRQHHRPSTSATAFLDNVLSRGQLSMRGYDKCLRLAWTLADLNGHDSPDKNDLAAALWLRGVDFQRTSRL